MPSNRSCLWFWLSLAACGSDFDPPSYLKDVRVLAITSDKLEAGPGESVTLQPVVFVPPALTVTKVEWSFCPLTLGSAAAFGCIAPQCETALATAPDQSTTANPLALGLACFSALSAAADGGLGAGGSTSMLTQVVDTVFRLRVTTSDGAVKEAVQRFPLYPFAVPAVRNRPLVITGVTVAGAAPDGTGRFPAQLAAAAPLLPAEVAVEVTLDPASLDRYGDATGASYTEAPVVSFYVTAGRLKQDRSSGVRGTVKWKAEKLLPGDTEALLYVVARDLRGGETVAGPFRWAITRR